MLMDQWKIHTKCAQLERRHDIIVITCIKGSYYFTSPISTAVFIYSMVATKQGAASIQNLNYLFMCMRESMKYIMSYTSQLAWKNFPFVFQTKSYIA